MTSGELRDRGNVVALLVALNDDIELAWQYVVASPKSNHLRPTPGNRAAPTPVTGALIVPDPSAQGLALNGTNLPERRFGPVYGSGIRPSNLALKLDRRFGHAEWERYATVLEKEHPLRL